VFAEVLRTPPIKISPKEHMHTGVAGDAQKEPRISTTLEPDLEWKRFKPYFIAIISSDFILCPIDLLLLDPR